jgi:hypothetical protein
MEFLDFLQNEKNTKTIGGKPFSCYGKYTYEYANRVANQLRKQGYLARVIVSPDDVHKYNVWYFGKVIYVRNKSGQVDTKW